MTAPVDRIRRIGGVLALAALGGCQVGPDYRPATAVELKLPDRYKAPNADSAASEDLSQWWTHLDDPALSGLVEKALAGNLDIAVAATRLRQAREQLVQARAEGLPTLSGSGRGGRNFDSDLGDRGSFSVGADASWQIDLFGGIARSIQASRADLEASGYDLASVRTAIAAEVARNYVAARQAQASLAIARDTLVTQDDNLDIAHWRVQAGLVSSIDEEQARAQRAQTAATIPSFEQNFANAANRLSVLTGEAPGAVDAALGTAADIPKGPERIAVGIPADTLRQRPDVRRAERDLAAATARIGVAEAQLYPQLRLTGNVGTAALSLGGLGDVITGGLFAGLSQLIFDGGRARSAVRGQKAAADGALAAYRQTVLGGLEEVENALVGLRTARARQEALAVQLQASENAAIYARSQYRAGLIDFRTQLDAERSLLSARDGIVQARAAETQALIQLYLALGGGWQPLEAISSQAGSPDDPEIATRQKHSVESAS